MSEAFKTFKQLHTLDASTASSADVVGQLAAAALEQDPAASSSLQEYLQSLPPMMPEDVDKLEEAGRKLSLCEKDSRTDFRTLCRRMAGGTSFSLSQKLL